MARWKVIVIVILSAFPVLLLAGRGAWALYRSGEWFYLWWALPICWGLSAFLSRMWARDLRVPISDLEAEHWTPQDKAAARIVQTLQEKVSAVPADKLTDPKYYTELTQSLAFDIARHYHPNARDPLGARSVVEVLAAAHLISEDMENWFLKYVPASHLVTVAQWRMLQHAPAWYQTASNIGWIASIALNPLNVTRYIASKVALDPLSTQFQQNLLGTFYTLYVRQAGYYLIELNSGRLRGGSKRYRQLMLELRGDALPQTAAAASDATTESVPSSTPVTITIALIGQVKAGKSSLTNCLLGDQRAVTDILPATQTVARYTLRWKDRSESIVLLDTPGYSDAGATAEQLRETQAAVRDADLCLLVLDARSPARSADVDTLDKLDVYFTAHPRLKPAPLLVVLNKIDGLSPVMLWAPPYDWRSPKSPKEQSIAGALAYAREVFGSRAVDYVPVCADFEHDRIYNVAEELMPAMSRHLDSARASALLRGLHAEYDRQKFRHVVGQVVEVGKNLLGAVDAIRESTQWDSERRPPRSP